MYEEEENIVQVLLQVWLVWKVEFSLEERIRQTTRYEQFCLFGGRGCFGCYPRGPLFVTADDDDDAILLYMGA